MILSVLYFHAVIKHSVPRGKFLVWASWDFTRLQAAAAGWLLETPLSAWLGPNPGALDG